MRAVVVLVALAAIGMQASPSPPMAIFSFQDTSCGAWVKSGTDESARAQYISWFRGFVSGHNFGNPGNQVQLERMPDPATLALYVDKYCRDNPLMPFVSASFDLVREIRERPEPKPPNARSKK